MLDSMGSYIGECFWRRGVLTDGKRMFWFPNGRFSCVFEIAYG
jgi:hypothetical protein